MSKRLDVWQTRLPEKHIGFKAIAKQLSLFESNENFPSIEQYNQQSSRIINAKNQTIKFFQQSDDCSEHYEQKIHEEGLVNTRDNNWHDFFNYIVWQAFPQAKSVINQLQYQDYQAQQFSTKRTAKQNFLTQFDESGVIVLCSSIKLISLLKNHQWHELFWEEREALQTQMQFIVFGHAIYEKLLSPYIGLTGKGIILDVADEAQVALALAEHLRSLNDCRAKDLQPVPLLGIPGWHELTAASTFYANENYFRKK